MSSETIITSLITTGGVIIVALISIVTARLANKSAKASARVEERAKVIEGYDKLNEDLQTQNTKLTERVVSLEKKLEVLVPEVESQRKRIQELESEKEKHQRDFRTLLRYCRILIQIMRDNNLDIPAQPLEILDYGSS